MSKQLCVYCQVVEATESDHVPPTNLFPKPRPALVTVPACESCNRGAALDDEYFRSIIVSRVETEDDPAANELRALVFRSFDRSDGWRAGWFDKTRLVDVVDEAGRAIDSKMQVQPNYARMAKVADRTVRGLHYNMFGAPLPKDCPIFVMQDWGLEPEHRSTGTKIANFLANFDDTAPNVIHPDIFTYKRESVIGEELTAAWLLLYFKCIWIVGLVNVDAALPVSD